MEDMVRPLIHFADFTGRSRRREFWLYLLLFMLVFLPMMIVALAGSFSTTGLGTSEESLVVLALIVTLLFLIPLFAVEARRFHDQDLPGWLVLLNLVPGIGIWAVLLLMLLDGTKGPNRYGPDPKGREPALRSDRTASRSTDDPVRACRARPPGCPRRTETLGSRAAGPLWRNW